MVGVLIRVEGDLKHRDIQRRPSEDRGRIYRHTSTAKECLRPPELGRGKILSLILQREHGPVNTWVSDLWPPEPRENTLLRIQPAARGPLLRQAQGTAAGLKHFSNPVPWASDYKKLGRISSRTSIKINDSDHFCDPACQIKTLE